MVGRASFWCFKDMVFVVGIRDVAYLVSDFFFLHCMETTDHCLASPVCHTTSRCLLFFFVVCCCCKVWSLERCSECEALIRAYQILKIDTGQPQPYPVLLYEYEKIARYHILTIGI